MAATWQTDIDAAQDWVDGLIAQTAEGRGWSAGVQTAADQIAADSVPTGMAGWFADPQDYYEELTKRWHSSAPVNPPPGWDELGATWASAGNASYTASEEARLGSPVTLVTDTIAASTADLGQAGDSGLAFFSPTKGWIDPTGYKFWLVAVPSVWAGFQLYKYR